MRAEEFEFPAAELDVEVLRAAPSAVMNGRLISVGGSWRARSSPSPRRPSGAEAPCGPARGRCPRPFELVDQPVDDALVEVVAAEVGVAIGGLDVKVPSPMSSIETSNVPPPRS